MIAQHSRLRPDSDWTYDIDVTSDGPTEQEWREIAAQHAKNQSERTVQHSGLWAFVLILFGIRSARSKSNIKA